MANNCRLISVITSMGHFERNLFIHHYFYFTVFIRHICGLKHSLEPQLSHFIFALKCVALLRVACIGSATSIYIFEKNFHSSHCKPDS